MRACSSAGAWWWWWGGGGLSLDSATTGCCTAGGLGSSGRCLQALPSSSHPPPPPRYPNREEFVPTHTVKQTVFAEVIGGWGGWGAAAAAEQGCLPHVCMRPDAAGACGCAAAAAPAGAARTPALHAQVCAAAGWSQGYHPSISTPTSNNAHVITSGAPSSVQYSAAGQAPDAVLLPAGSRQFSCPSPSTSAPASPAIHPPHHPPSFHVSPSHPLPSTLHFSACKGSSALRVRIPARANPFCETVAFHVQRRRWLCLTRGHLADLRLCS